jgi:PAS domain S-box-containing protein
VSATLESAGIDRLLESLHELRLSTALPALWTGEEGPYDVRALLDSLPALVDDVTGQVHALVAANRDLRTEIAERQLAEDSLREREDESRLIMDTIPGMVALLTSTGEIERLNRQLLDYFGQSQDELRDWATNGTIHPDDVAHVVEVFSESIASGRPYDIVQRFRRWDGVYRWAQNRGFPLHDRDGQIIRWCVLLTDIDERKRAETQLAGEKRLLEMVASGASLSDVLDALCRFVEDAATNCHCGVYLVDRRGPIFRNAAAPTLPASFNDPIDRLPVRSELGPCGRAACLKTQVIVADVESDALWQASAFRALALANGLRSCWSTPICSLDGHVLGTFVIYRRTPGSPAPLQQDLITQVTHIASIAIERARKETALTRSEAFLSDGQRLSLTGSFSWHVTTDEITWSEQLYRIYDIEPGTPVTPELIRTRVHPEDVSLLEKMKSIDHAGRGGGFEWQYRLLMPDGSIKYLHAVSHAMRDANGQLEYIAAVQDVTERRLSEEAIAKARAELAKVASATSLGVLTAAIAHEVNQPLAGIMTNAGTCLRMLDATPPHIDGARETARRTIRDSNRASDVIARLRALFARKEFTLEALDLNDAAREVVALASSDLQRNRIVLQPEFAEDLPVVTGDRVQLQQVILNLLRNGAEAMADVQDRPRQLVIRTERDDDRVRLAVRDAGVGLPLESVDSLFDAFFTTKNGGMGIGLFVSRSIIERHQGRLWAEPNRVGPGATFSLSIPCALERSS